VELPPATSCKLLLLLLPLTTELQLQINKGHSKKQMTGLGVVGWFLGGQGGPRKKSKKKRDESDVHLLQQRQKKLVTCSILFLFFIVFLTRFLGVS
jgi:hypothetical protein